MIVILAEKPSAARNFATALGGMKGKYKGEDYEIVHALGHIFAFPSDPEKLAGEKYKSWSWKNLPWNEGDFKWKKYRNNGTKDVYDKIKAAIGGASEVVMATDYDPSGEGFLLGYEILDALNWKGKTTRMYFMDESEKEVRKAFEQRREIKKLEANEEFLKADTRSKFDYLSMQFTRAATLCAGSAGKRMTVREGRLKSVMVYLVGEQLELVKNYERVPFYTARYIDENGHTYKRKDEEQFTDIAEVSLEPYKPSKVIVDKEEKKKSPPPSLMDLAALSSVLAARGYKAKDVLSCYQKMYEQQYVSYPRTEDKFITPEQFNELLPLASKIANVVGVDSSLLTHTAPRDTHVKTGGAHGANRPGPKVPGSLGDIESSFGKLGKAIYEILAKGFLAILCEDYEYNHQSGHLKDYPEFKGSANVPLSLGYKAVFDSDSLEEESEENNKPLGESAEAFIFEGANPKPQNPTVTWLIGKKGKLTKFNVGTGATRTSTLAEITNATSKTQLMTETKGVLGLTETGEVSYTLLKGCQIASPEITEQLFSDMEEVGKGKKKPAEVLVKVSEIMRHDMNIMQNNAMNINVSEKIEGTYCDGKDAVRVKFNKTWSGHEFTPDEIDLLLKGQEIVVEAVSKKGKPFKAKGKLAEQEYKGKKFWGFKAELVPEEDSGRVVAEFNGQQISFKRIWGGHEFTDQEIRQLLNGATVTFDAVSKKGKPYMVSGKLAEQTYKGKKFWGFKPEF